MKKQLIIGVSVAALTALALTGCSGGSSRGGSGSTSGASSIPKGSTIGVSLPAKTSQNWVLAKAAFESALKADGAIRTRQAPT